MKKEEKPLGLYIHIPFCKSKCAYCDFYSLPHSEDRMDAYVGALIRHLEEVAPQAAGHRVDTVYFGGGTPSYLGGKRLGKLLQTIKRRYNVAGDAEITMEANPDSAGDWRELRALRRAGINRISLGVQSGDDAMLRQLGRVHTWEQVGSAVEAARKAKLDNISVDLIYGLPGQTMSGWQQTLEDVMKLQPRHVSCYGLKLEEGTPLWQRQAEYTFPDDDLQADMYLWAVEFLQHLGYVQYEISNFAQPGYESRHNLKYWQLEEYAGFGPGAHSDFGGVRFAYERDLEAYLRGELLLSEESRPERQERAREYIMLSLRTAAGLDVRRYEYTYRRHFAPLEALLMRYAQADLAERTEAGWRLTPKGFLVSNQIIGELLDAAQQEADRRAEATARGDFRVKT